jgi:hypothetical protein
MRTKQLVAGLLFLCLMASLVMAQDHTKVMSNKDVTDMVAIGLSEDLVQEKIRTAEVTEFDTSVEGLKALKAANVPDSIIKLMINPKAAPVVPASVAAAAKVDSGLPDDIGVYFKVKSNEKLTEILPEIVNWRTGGYGKMMLTDGLDKGHVNGTVSKPKSALQLYTPVEFVIKCPDGTSAAEYQLMRLDRKGDRREFRARTGGIVHASSGGERNKVEFQFEKIAPRTYRVKIDELKRGEYGFLPPGNSSVSIASSGKMYTFGIIE